MKRNIKTARGKGPFRMFFVSVKKKIRLLSIYWKRKFSFAHFFSSLVNRKNAKRYAFVAGLFFLVIASATSLFYYNELRTPESSSSPEVGFSSLSPSGSLGGEILPASCEAPHNKNDPWVPCCISNGCDALNTSLYCTTQSCTDNCSGNVRYGTKNCTTGCTNSSACNYNASAGVDDGSCFYNRGACSVTSDPNACGNTVSASGTYDCSWNCSASKQSPPANPWYLGASCPSAANACGQVAWGTYNCAGACSASTPANPPGYGSACTSSANACGATNAGSIQCNGACSASTPANPPGYGNACTGATSSPNACGQTSPGGAGSIQCNGSCSGATGSTPANPWYLGVGCSSSANACGQTNSGTYNCAGTCSASTPANPPGYGNACTSSANACGTTNTGSIQCNGSCSASTPANPPGYGNACTSSANACGQTQSNGSIQCNGSCSSTPPANPWYLGVGCSSSANACGQTNSGTYNCAGTCSASTPPNSNCPAPIVDLKINGSDGPISLIQGAPKNISWNTTYATSCTASSNDGFAGSKSVPSGSETVSANTTSNHTLDCVNVVNVHTTDSVQVNVFCTQSCGAWSSCSVACDGGTQTRSCTDTSCLPYTDNQVCNTIPCSSNYNWKEVAP